MIKYSTIVHVYFKYQYLKDILNIVDRILILANKIDYLNMTVLFLSTFK